MEKSERIMHEYGDADMYPVFPNNREELMEFFNFENRYLVLYGYIIGNGCCKLNDSETFCSYIRCVLFCDKNDEGICLRFIYCRYRKENNYKSEATSIDISPEILQNIPRIIENRQRVKMLKILGLPTKISLASDNC